MGRCAAASPVAMMLGGRSYGAVKGARCVVARHAGLSTCEGGGAAGRQLAASCYRQWRCCFCELELAARHAVPGHPARP